MFVLTSELKICTFNVNSIRARKDLILTWLKKRNNDLDILCLQEIKVVETLFPSKDLEKYDFRCKVYGQKGFNGVAICSKTPLEDLKKGFGDNYWDEQKRIISCKIRDVNIINIYAPHGDQRGEEKYYYKLKWFKTFLDFLKKNYSPEERIIVVGDLNVAKADFDVYDPAIVGDSIGTMIEEKTCLEELLVWGLIDAFRYLHPKQKQFTWWDYIGGAIWKDEGMRIDYVLCTKPLVNNIKDVEVDLWPRRRRTPKPSDHAPVIVTLEL